MGEELTSTARLMINKWHHITVIKAGEKIKLYINGILDAVTFLSTFSTSNMHNFFIGNTPSLKDECSVPMFLDDFKIYNRPLSNYEIQAEASTSLGGIEPAFLHFGCVNCELEKAKGSCVQGFHLCTSLELYSGIYQVARIMGWIEWNNNLWSYNSLLNNRTQTDDVVKKGLGICCRDLTF